MQILREGREDNLTVKTTQAFIKTGQDEIKNVVTSVATRVEDMATKIDRIYASPILNSANEHPKAFDGVELLRSVQRVISDNDRLRKEVADKIVRFSSSFLHFKKGIFLNSLLFFSFSFSLLGSC